MMSVRGRITWGHFQEAQGVGISLLCRGLQADADLQMYYHD